MDSYLYAIRFLHPQVEEKVVVAGHSYEEIYKELKDINKHIYDVEEGYLTKRCVFIEKNDYEDLKNSLDP